MGSESDKRAVLDTLRGELRKDRARAKAFAVSDLGLVEMTRQRERSSLLHYHTEDCPTCGGLGKVPSNETMLVKLERVLRRVAALGGIKRVTVKIAPELALYFVETKARRFAELEKRFKIQVDLKGDPQLKRGEMRVFNDKKQDLTSRSWEQCLGRELRRRDGVADPAAPRWWGCAPDRSSTYRMSTNRSRRDAPPASARSQ